MPTVFRVLFAAFMLVAPAPLDSVQARKADIYSGFLSSRALNGYDAVAYFTDGKPVRGRSEFSYSWKGATWLFANQKNLDAFKAKPEAFAPQFGGYCAWAVSQGYTAKGDPNHWKIFDGKLYLNYDARVQRDWERDIPGHISKGNGNWPAVLDK